MIVSARFGVTPRASSPLARKLAADPRLNAAAQDRKLDRQAFEEAARILLAAASEKDRAERLDALRAALGLLADRIGNVASAPVLEPQPEAPAPAKGNGEASAPLCVNDIIAAVCACYGVRRVDILSTRRVYRVVRPRQVVAFLARRFTLRSLPEIARTINKDHTTVLHSVRRVKAVAAAHNINAGNDPQAWIEALHALSEVDWRVVNGRPGGE